MIEIVLLLEVLKLIGFLILEIIHYQKEKELLARNKQLSDKFETLVKSLKE